MHESSGWIILVQLSRGIEDSEHRGIQSDTEQGPPESDRMEALTAKIYAMVRKVAVPARSSVVKVVFLSLILKRLPTLLSATKVFRRVSGG